MAHSGCQKQSFVQIKAHLREFAKYLRFCVSCKDAFVFFRAFDDVAFIHIRIKYKPFLLGKLMDSRMKFGSWLVVEVVKSYEISISSLFLCIKVLRYLK